jgi:hypothetical protein
MGLDPNSLKTSGAIPVREVPGRYWQIALKVLSPDHNSNRPATTQAGEPAAEARETLKIGINFDRTKPVTGELKGADIGRTSPPW